VPLYGPSACKWKKAHCQPPAHTSGAPALRKLRALCGWIEFGSRRLPVRLAENSDIQLTDEP
jgi:hypothetical protein